MYDENQRKLLSALSHGSIFFSALLISIGIPIGIFMVSGDPVIKENAKEALNFHISVWIYGAIFGLLCFLVIGFPLLALLFIASLVMPILAIVKVLERPDIPHRYPFIFHFLQ